MLLGGHDDAPHAHPARAPQHVAQQGVDLSRLSCGRGQVRLVEVDAGDLVRLDEGFDLDRLGRFGQRLADLVLAQRDELAAVHLDAFHDFSLRHGLAGRFVDLLVSDRPARVRVEHAHLRTRLDRGGVQRDGDEHQPKADAALPEGTSRGRGGHAAPYAKAFANASRRCCAILVSGIPARHYCSGGVHLRPPGLAASVACSAAPAFCQTPPS